MPALNLPVSNSPSRDDHRTVANPALQARIDATPQGMMHWCGTGPADAKCFGCAEFNQRKLRTVAEREAPETVLGACAKYDRITAARAGHGVARRIFDPATPACSHFTPKATEPAPS